MLTLNPSEENYCMTLVLKMENLCSGQGKFKHLTFNCYLDLGHIRTFCMTLVLVQENKYAKFFLKSIVEFNVEVMF